MLASPSSPTQLATPVSSDLGTHGSPPHTKKRVAPEILQSAAHPYQRRRSVYALGPKGIPRAEVCGRDGLGFYRKLSSRIHVLRNSSFFPAAITSCAQYPTSQGSGPPTNRVSDHSLPKGLREDKASTSAMAFWRARSPGQLRFEPTNRVFRPSSCAMALPAALVHPQVRSRRGGTVSSPFLSSSHSSQSIRSRYFPIPCPTRQSSWPQFLRLHWPPSRHDLVLMLRHVLLRKPKHLKSTR